MLVKGKRKRGRGRDVRRRRRCRRRRRRRRCRRRRRRRRRGGLQHHGGGGGDEVLHHAVHDRRAARVSGGGSRRAEVSRQRRRDVGRPRHRASGGRRTLDAASTSADPFYAVVVNHCASPSSWSSWLHGRRLRHPSRLVRGVVCDARAPLRRDCSNDNACRLVFSSRQQPSAGREQVKRQLKSELAKKTFDPKP